MKLQAAYSPVDEKESQEALKALESLGISVPLVKDEPEKDVSLVLAFFSSRTKEEDFLSSLPWLRRQREYSSLPFFRVMPVFLYHSSSEDPEQAFEGSAGRLYEDVFSGEFKPFGFDFDSPRPLSEFPRILSEYLE
jgi:hypothetical protein